MKEWNKPEISQLGVENTKDNCTTKDKHDHCDKGDSSSSCDCKIWEPIGPANPIEPGAGDIGS